MGKKFSIDTGSMLLQLDFSSDYPLRELIHKDSGTISNKDRELFQIKIYGSVLSNKDFELKQVLCAEDEVEKLIGVHYAKDEDQLEVKVFFIWNKRKECEDKSLRILYQVYDGYKYGVPYDSFIRIPLVSDIEYDGGRKDTLLPPGCQFRNSAGKPVIVPMSSKEFSSDIKLPLVLLGEDKKHGYSITFPNYSDLENEGCVQNQSKFFALMDTVSAVRSGFVRMAPDASFNDTVEIKINAIDHGWPEAFDKYRDDWASEYDFSEYERKDLQWIKETAVHYFLFLYGNEGFDHKTGKFDIQGLLERGKEFGGFDTVTFWNQYPRLGIDERNQWDFHKDFPGGIEAIREAIGELHKRGIKVLLPFIPWDRGNQESTDSMGTQFAELIKMTDADGYQMDTMYNVPFSFRKKTDEIKQGVLLQSQFHPVKNHPTEFITSSWDEYWAHEAMPEVDVFRFMLPEHIAPVISRWQRCEGKTELIQRAIFDAAPIMIWTDVFGRIMSYTEEQKKMIREWKSVYMKFRGIFQGSKSIPLYPISKEGLYCNVYSDGNGSDIYAIYNETEEMTSGEIDLWHDSSRVDVILGSGRMKLCENKLNVQLSGKQIMQVLVSR